MPQELQLQVLPEVAASVELLTEFVAKQPIVLKYD